MNYRDLNNDSHFPIQETKHASDEQLIFTMNWRRLMKESVVSLFEETKPKLFHILRDLSRFPDDRDGRVCTSLAFYLGCNGGRSFRIDAKRLMSTGVFENQEHAYLAQWSIENTRYSWLNRGLRVLEHILGSGDLEARDYETAEHFVRWLGSEEGQSYLALCEEQAKRQKEVQSKTWQVVQY